MIDTNGFFRGAAVLLLGLACLLAVPGCLWVFNQEFVEPEFDIRDSRVAVLPFRHNRYWYGETEEGAHLARHIGYEIQAECDGVTPIYDETAEEMLADNVRDPVPWQEIGAAAKADYLVFGNIQTLKLKKPQMIAMLAGQMRCTVKVFNVERNQIEYEREVEVHYPKDPTSGEIHVAFEQNEAQVKRKLYGLMATKIQRLLCGWIRDKSMPDDI